MEQDGGEHDGEMTSGLKRRPSSLKGIGFGSDLAGGQHVKYFGSCAAKNYCRSESRRQNARSRMSGYMRAGPAQEAVYGWVKCMLLQ